MQLHIRSVSEILTEVVRCHFRIDCALPYPSEHIVLDPLLPYRSPIIKHLLQHRYIEEA